METAIILPDADRQTKVNLPVEYFEARWYAAYTSARHEKRVGVQLERRFVEHFLPLYDSVRRWKDRRKQLRLPLFPGYIFVRLALRDRLKVLQVPGVSRLVGFNGTPTPLADEDVERLRLALARGVRAEPHPYILHPCIKVGRRVRVTDGPLAGSEGVLVRRKGRTRVVISIELVQRSIIVDVDVTAVSPMVERSAREGRAKGRENPYSAKP